MKTFTFSLALAACLTLPGGVSAQSGETLDLTDAQREELVRRSYQNDRFKYSVGENAGFKLDEDGGIRIVIAAEQPDGVPEENWLPINRADMDLDIIMRLYAPDVERYERWTAPIARRVN